jgi:septum formation protein
MEKHKVNLPPKPLILASSSPQRKKLLSKLKIPYKIIPSHVSENTREKNPRKMVIQLAVKKALFVAKRNKEYWVLGADTTVVSRGKIIGKPRNPKDSRRILEFLNGQKHKVYTGAALVINGGKMIFKTVSVTKLQAKKLGEKELSSLAGKHLDKAGSYAIQDRDDPFIESIDGPLDNVIGLHLDAIQSLFAKAQSAYASRASGKTK